MSRAVNKATANPIGALIAGTECIKRCEAFAACGGNRGEYPWAIACGCPWTQSSGKRHKCEKCALICRERKRKGPNGLEPDFASRLNEGLLLDQVTVDQKLEKPFPLYIPTNTHELALAEAPYGFSWAAADIREMFNAAAIDPHFATPESTRRHLRVRPGCNLIAVLNAQDSSLEKFWATKRSRELKILRASGFTISTGATFSVNYLTVDGTQMPYAHNVAMLMRHHRVMHEIQAVGMEVVPNIYWVDGDQRELGHWAEWLIANPRVTVVSRDFTSTRDAMTILGKLRELISMLNQIGRSFHVLVVGGGPKTAPLALKALVEAGHSGSIVTAAPIHAANKNAMYHLGSDGRIAVEERKDRTIPFPELRMHNMKVFEQALFAGIAHTASVSSAPPNIC